MYISILLKTLGLSHYLSSFLQLRPGFDPSGISKAVDTIEVPTNGGHGNGSVCGLVASRCGLMAVLEGNYRNMYIYNQERSVVLEFSLNCPEVSYMNQIAFDRHHNIVIAHGGQSSLLRYNMNGKALPNLKLPEYINSLNGVACSPEGDLYVSSSDPYTIVKKEAGKSEWVTLYGGEEDDYDEDEDEDDEEFDPDYDIFGDEYDEDNPKHKFDPARFSPGQMCVGSDGDLFVATSNCINVLAASDGKVKRQIGCDKYRDGELWKVEGICATGDGYLFVCDSHCYAHAFTAGGDYLCKFGGNGDDRGQFQEPWAITVDWSGYLLISDIGNGCIQVY